MNTFNMSTMDENNGKILILGLGNELLGDDAVGLLVVQELRRRLGKREDLVFVEASVGGMALLDLLRGYRNLIMVDAIKTGKEKPGTIYRLSEDDFPEGGSTWSAHQMSLKFVLETGRRCGCPVPERVVIYAVEAADMQTWQRGCTCEVQEAIAVLVRRIIREEFSLDHPVLKTL